MEVGLDALPTEDEPGSAGVVMEKELEEKLDTLEVL